MLEKHIHATSKLYLQPKELKMYEAQIKQLACRG